MAEGELSDLDYGETPESNNNEDQIIITTETDHVLDFILGICGNKKMERVSARLKNLGVTNLSDLEVLELKEAFAVVLTPVEIGKLQKELNQVANSQPEQKKTGQEIIDINKVFSSNQLDALKGVNRLPHNEAIDITNAVGNHLYLNISPISQNLCLRVAQVLLTKFPKALTLVDADLSEQKLAGQIMSNVRYRQKLKRRKEESLVTNRLQLNKFSKRQCHGLEPQKDLPTEFPDGESRVSQEEKRLKLIKMQKTGEVNWATVKLIMKETYVAQRLTINGLQAMDKILLEWPYIGKFSILKAHFYTLMGLESKDVDAQLNNSMPNVIKFLTAEANKDRKKNLAEVVKRVRKIVKKYEDTSEKSAELEFICVILGLGAKMEVDMAQLIKYFPDTASYDEIQASKELPKKGKPFIAVLGNDLFKLPKCFVLVDNCIISREPCGPLKALMSVFMAYFVFKITYPKELHPLLNYVERDIFNLKIKSSSRVERERNAKGAWLGTPVNLAPRYVTFKGQLQDYLDMW